MTGDETATVARDRTQEPGDREPAPGALAHVQSFVNTIDLEEDRDDLAVPEALRDWLIRHGLLDPADDVAITNDDLRETIRLREAIRALLIANAGGEPQPEAVAILNRQAEAAQLGVIFDDESASLHPRTTGLNGAIGRLLAIIFEAMTDGSWARLKACRYDSCRWAYFDTSKNRSGSWCSMAICGNRAKTRSYRARRRNVVSADISGNERGTPTHRDST
jgi:predicted RNA-binding Zn ribbon-like protein